MSPEEIAKTVAGFQADENEIVSTIVQRIDRGRGAYGPWEIGSDHYRDYRREALEEVLDGMNYIAAELVRMKNERDGRSMRVYIAHPWSDDPQGNAEDIKFICKGVVTNGALPIAPQLYLPHFLEEETQRELALKFCLELLADCDLVLAFGVLTPGMKRELDFARARGIPIRRMGVQEAS
jgi:hypothetical protein